ncbi:MAG: sodium/proton antiporter NhaB [Nitrospinae bacterium]|nr:sodium/proton antiporter NhaB [Nitrospinota bacterium]
MPSLASAFKDNFMGYSPAWYELAVISFLILNPILLFTAGPFITGWILMAQFIFTLAMALKCYPLQPGGLLAIEAVALGMTTPENVYDEVAHNFPVILLLMFMVAGIYFMKELLLFIFANLLVKVRSKIALALLFCALGAFLSAFLDALTVTAVIIAVGVGFYTVFHRYASARGEGDGHDTGDDSNVADHHRSDLEDFRGFLRNVLMHGAVGTALGGVTTLVGEPQNLLIGHEMGWHFGEFFFRMAPVTMPVLAMGLLTCVAVEKFKLFGYGYLLPDSVRVVLEEYSHKEREKLDNRARARMITQAVVGVMLILALAIHIAEVGLIGLTVIVLLTAFNGITEEHRIGRAFEEALPFTALLVVFFTVVAVIHDQHLFKPLVDWTLTLSGSAQLVAFYVANGLLSSISDNVFVATIYITQAKAAFEAGALTREQFDLIAVAINTGTNIPSVATPNGQAAFLFLLTSAVAAMIRLSYVRMIILALPYTVSMSLTGLLAVMWWL